MRKVVFLLPKVRGDKVPRSTFLMAFLLPVQKHQRPVFIIRSDHSKCNRFLYIFRLTEVRLRIAQRATLSHAAVRTSLKRV